MNQLNYVRFSRVRTPVWIQIIWLVGRYIYWWYQAGPSTCWYDMRIHQSMILSLCRYDLLVAMIHYVAENDVCDNERRIYYVILTYMKVIWCCDSATYDRITHCLCWKQCKADKCSANRYRGDLHHPSHISNCKTISIHNRGFIIWTTDSEGWTEEEQDIFSQTIPISTSMESLILCKCFAEHQLIFCIFISLILNSCSCFIQIAFGKNRINRTYVYQ